MKIDLSISLVTYKNKELLEKCLTSIYKNTKNINFEILLIDNASNKETAQMVKKKFPQIKLIQNSRNLFFTKAHNQNLKKIKGKYFLVLNDDTLIPSKTLEKMVAFMDKNPYVGLSSCRHVNEFNITDNTCSKLPHPILEILEGTLIGKIIKIFSPKKTGTMLKKFRYGNWKRYTVKKVEVIPGSFFMGRSELLNKIGYFDENLLLFYEEADYCQKAKLQGFASYHIGTVKISHFQSKSFSKLPPLQRFQISRHDILHYYKKHFGNIWWLLLLIAFFPDWIYLQVKTLNNDKK